MVTTHLKVSLKYTIQNGIHCTKTTFKNKVSTHKAVTINSTLIKTKFPKLI